MLILHLSCAHGNILKRNAEMTTKKDSGFSSALFLVLPEENLVTKTTFQNVKKSFRRCLQ
jgi:hypothetical protein